MPNTVSLTEAEQELAAATATVDQLKAKILDHGPGAVTAEELGHAALAVEHAKLAVQHAAQRAHEQAAAERVDNLQLLKRQIVRDAGDVDTALDAMQRIEHAATELITACTGRQQLIAQATAAMRRAAVPEGSTPDDAHAGLGWSSAGMGRGDSIHVDGRTIASLSAGMLIAAALQRALRQAGAGVGHLNPIALHHTSPELASNPEAWLKRRY